MENKLGYPGWRKAIGRAMRKYVRASRQTCRCPRTPPTGGCGVAVDRRPCFQFLQTCKRRQVDRSRIIIYPRQIIAMCVCACKHRECISFELQSNKACMIIFLITKLPRVNRMRIDWAVNFDFGLSILTRSPAWVGLLLGGSRLIQPRTASLPSTPFSPHPVRRSFLSLPRHRRRDIAALYEPPPPCSAPPPALLYPTV